MESPVPDRPLTCRAFIRYTLAAFQILAGAHPLLFDWKLLLDPSVVGVLTVGIDLLLIAAGLGLILHLRTGRLLTIIAQGIQVIGIATPGFAWVVHSGVATRVTLSGVHSELPGESSGTVGASFEYASKVNVAWGQPHPEYEGYMLSLNFVALAILVAVITLFRTRRESP